MTDPLDSMEPRWIEAADSPWGVRVFDCRAMAVGMNSSTPSAADAETFVATRTSDGSHLFGRHPDNPVRIDVEMQYPVDLRNLPDRGMIYRASVMEEKWDIALDDGVVTFARSWTGNVVYNCDLVRNGGLYNVTTIVVNDELVDDNDPYYHVHVVNYLLFSHVFDVVYPHPLPQGHSEEVDDILIGSFAQFGKLGWFATFEHFGSAE